MSLWPAAGPCDLEPTILTLGLRELEPEEESERAKPTLQFVIGFKIFSVNSDIKAKLMFSENLTFSHKKEIVTYDPNKSSLFHTPYTFDGQLSWKEPKSWKHAVISADSELVDIDPGVTYLFCANFSDLWCQAQFLIHAY